ncbi:benzoate/H(+) symporter BenE family transporter [Hoeflea prorocentri]|uniref:Benzoate/H(+) symporter BenE family transporter n=1 Tax=Hoeflea prorocentri TaxID=1922333 RepID=A0A9X3ZH75_9HYPH|nr:benzoate/H(+) symporter BenE family transporter [Hoeflea prorocentri]MCY6380475.1 benzoate/H(+) symporter BenE family transporter [Hoeflea prorocentri]MDA5398275.1 benzoate/H(+) symporter BenE family transporter [Hoeflea prorocentri]
MPASIVISALVAVLVGFGSSVAIVLAAASAVGANAAQTSSWIAAICLATAAITLILSLRYKMPIVAAWSTPGAALIAQSTGESIETAVGAFIFAALLTLLTAAFRPLAALIERIPASVAAAMLAGILFSFVLGVFTHLKTAPELVLPLLLLFVLIRVFSPIWAVLSVLLCGIILTYVLGLAEPPPGLRISNLEWITPQFRIDTLIGLGLPLYLVTMASQNLPGFAVLKASGFTPPSRPVLAVTGLASLASAGFGAHTTNLAAITASICTGPDAHPDPKKRWLCGPVYAAGYVIIALFGASLVALFASFPSALIATIASIALIGALAASLGAGLAEEKDRFVAVATFAVTASGLSAFGIGSAFWGLAAGLLIYGVDRVYRRIAR